jgi:type I restriction enzyme M protein
VLGQVYEYFLGQFASAEGKKGGQFYTPAASSKRWWPCWPRTKARCTTLLRLGGMFVQSEKFIEAHGGKMGDVSIYGQESNPTTWRLAAMNLAIRGIDFNLGKARRHLHATSTRPARRLHPGQPALQHQRLVARQPGGRPALGLWRPPRRATPTTPGCSTCCTTCAHGRAGIVLANGSMIQPEQRRRDPRRHGEADVVEVMVALPGQLFFNTQIPACLWFLAKPSPRSARAKCCSSTPASWAA